MVQLLVEKYYYEISKCQDVKDIFKYLPKKDIEQFDSIIKGIIQKLKEELDVLETLKEEGNSDNDDIEKEISLALEKIKVCKEYSEDVNIDSPVVFAHSESGNNLILSDINAIVKDAYPDVVKVLKMAFSNERVTDPRKHKKYQNQVLPNVWEYKSYQTRLYYMPINNKILFF